MTGEGRTRAIATTSTIEAPTQQLEQALSALEDGVRGYEAASDRTEDPGLATMLNDLSRRRAQVRSHLLRVTAEEMAFAPAGTDGTIRGMLVRTWMRIKSAVGDDDAIVTSAISTERQAAHELAGVLLHELPGPVTYAVRRALDDVRGACRRLERIAA